MRLSLLRHPLKTFSMSSLENGLTINLNGSARYPSKDIDFKADIITIIDVFPSLRNFSAMSIPIFFDPNRMSKNSTS